VTEDRHLLAIELLEKLGLTYIGLEPTAECQIVRIPFAQAHEFEGIPFRLLTPFHLGDSKS
jgi:hypothetical protein